MEKRYTSLFLFLILIMHFLIITSLVLASEHTNYVEWDYSVGTTSGYGDWYNWVGYGDDGDVVVHTVNDSTKSLHSHSDAGGSNDGVDIYTNYNEGTSVESIDFWMDWNYEVGYVFKQSDWDVRIYDQDDIFAMYLHFEGHRVGSSYPADYITKIYWIDANGTDILVKSYAEYGGDRVQHFFINYSHDCIYGSVFDITIMEAGAVVASITSTYLRWEGDWEYMTRFQQGIRATELNTEMETYLGKVRVKQDGFDISEPVYELMDLNFKLYDGETGDPLYVFGLGTDKILMAEHTPNVRCQITSDLWTGDYNPYTIFGYTITISNLNISSGGWHFFNISYASGYVSWPVEVKHYFNSTNYLRMYSDQTYSIYLSSTVEYGGYSNCQDTGYGENSYDYDFGDPGHRQLCTDKEWYLQGESINIRYVAPDPQWLYENGRPSGSYFIWIYDVDNLGFLWWGTDGGRSADNGDYLNDWAVSLDNNHHYLHWDYDPGETFGYKTVTGGIDHYKMFIGHGGGGLLGLDIKLTEGPEFYIEAGDYTPHGNITSISPSEPKLGQFVTIGFEANNNGYLTVKNVLAPGETEQVITNFQKFDGIETVTKQFFEFGSYELNLYVSSGIEFENVDADTFDIVDINGSFGDFGYGIEFLTVEPERAIAGYDVVFINYRSLDSTGEIQVIDARGQTTSYGTVVGQKRGVLNITLPNHASIGEWNVTLTTANNTLYSSFQVIAEENNWVEFYSNVYFENQQFELKLKHDKKIELVFYKDGQAIGTDWYLDVGIMPGGIYFVPKDKIIISPGSWKVEMWQVNNFIKIKKLAEDTCVVIETPIGYITDGGYEDIFSMLTIGASSIAGGGFGLAFMAIIFILVTIVVLANLKLKNDTIFFGAIVMALFMAFIGWLPIWIVVVSIVISAFLFSSAFSKKLKIGG